MGNPSHGDVELVSDGKGYPTNPTVASARVKPTTGQSADVLIKEYKDFSKTKALPPKRAAKAGEATVKVAWRIAHLQGSLVAIAP